MSTSLFILSGGGMRGLDVLAGQLQGLADAGITPTAICGTSAGAAIGALAAFGRPADEIADIISGLRDRDVRSERWFWKSRALWINHFMESAPIRALLHRWLPSTPDALAMPYACTTTRTMDGAETVWTSAQAVLPGEPMPQDWRECVLASMSISGVFPWVCIADAHYADGGVRANLPLPPNWRDFDEVYFLIASYTNDYAAAGSSIVSRLLLNASWYAQDQIEDVLARVAVASPARMPRVVTLRPPADAGRGSLLRFDHSLISSARQAVKGRLSQTV